MLLSWQSKYLKKNDEARKHIRNWSIPKKLRERYMLPDGLKINLLVKLEGLSEVAEVKLFSGGEFRLSEQLGKRLFALWLTNPISEIRFEFDLELNPPFLVDFEALLQSNLSEIKRKMEAGVWKGEKYYPEKPFSRLALVRVFNRNPHVVLTVLERANGKCEVCHAFAPFESDPGGEPFLEVHHIRWLARGGRDSIDNAVALCPNCHRQAHYGNQHQWKVKLKNEIQGFGLAFDDVEG